MKIKVNGKGATYQLSIYYHYKFYGGFTQKQFDSYDEFVDFMEECHPDVDYHEVGSKYSKLLEMLNKLADNGTVEEKYLHPGSTDVHCFISGNDMIVSINGTGILEKIYEHFSMSDKVNQGYLHTFLANNWSFDGQPGGYFKVSYWYNKESNKGVYKVHCFKNKVVFENQSGTIHSMIVCDKYYIHFEGASKS